MRIVFSILFFFAISANTLIAKNLGVSVGYASFLDDNNKPYVELYFALAGNSLNFKKMPSGKYQGALDVLVTFDKMGATVGFSKFRIKTDFLKDTLQVPKVLLHQERIPVDEGNLLLFIQMLDLADTTKAYPIEQRISVGFQNLVCSSDLVLLESFKASQAPSSFSKSGYDLYPIISSGIAYLPPTINKLNFYAEIYNTQKTFGENGAYAYRYFLHDVKTSNRLTRYGLTKRETAKSIQPVIGSFNITDLPTGKYELILEIIDNKGEVVYEKNTLFYRKAAAQPLSVILEKASKNPQNFAKKITEIDTLSTFIKYLSPVSSADEILMQKEILARKEQPEMQNYLFGFWEEKFPAQAAEIWRRYLTLVRYANTEFTSTMQPGYLTDRGYVYLVYGAPDQMENRKMEPSLPPYQIWQYQTVNSPFATRQTNKIFVFAEFQHPTNDYELIHSTAIGELQNDRWRYQLANGKLGTDNLDQSNPNMGDEMGSRLNNNTLIMDRGN